MKRYKSNNSFLGTAAHIEKKTIKRNKLSTKRSRYKCIYYDFSPRECKKTHCLCVGPSNKLCKYYCEDKKHLLSVNSTSKQGILIEDKKLGVGYIINNSYPYRVRFINKNIVKSYNEREIKELIKNSNK